TSSGTWPAAWAPTGMVFPDLWEEARKAPEFVEVARPIHQGRAESLVNQRRQPSDPFREIATVLPAVDDGEGVVATPFDDDLPVPDLYRLHHVVGPLREGIVDEVLDDLEHPHQDVLVLVGQEAGGPVGEEMARPVRDEHVLHAELGRAAPSPDHERSRKPARGRDRRPGGEVGGNRGWRARAESVTVSDVDIGRSRFPFPSVAVHRV